MHGVRGQSLLCAADWQRLLGVEFGAQRVPIAVFDQVPKWNGTNLL
jgi:hypothetical protein